MARAILRLLLIAQVAAEPASAVRPEDAVRGLWAYTALQPRDQAEFPLTGLFLFQDGFFVQHTVNDGEPFAEQGGQAHFGTYEGNGEELKLVAEIAVSTSPAKEPRLSLRQNTEHRVSPELARDGLTLRFGTGTVQKLRRLSPTKGQVHRLDRGVLVLVDGHFLLVARTDDGVVAGSGRFASQGPSLELRATRWFRASADRVVNRRELVLSATWDGQSLFLPEGLRFRVREPAPQR